MALKWCICNTLLYFKGQGNVHLIPVCLDMNTQTLHRQTETSEIIRIVTIAKDKLEDYNNVQYVDIISII